MFPEVAREADGWDPARVTAGSHSKRTWRCDKGHTWIAAVVKRTSGDRTGCPYCLNRVAWSGYNDLQTLLPTIAAEADGWDPTQVVAGSHERLPWKCEHGHTWSAPPSRRTSGKECGCPYCSNQKVWPGFNDLLTKYPDIAKEADGWDPSVIAWGSQKGCRGGVIKGIHGPQL
ncbi:MAG: zinc-ribbon domain-containing protein [Cyanobium sp.]